jgi:hypothetical protein
MRVATRRKAIVLFITLGACLVAVAIALNVTWIIINWRSLLLQVIGVLFFLLLIAGLILNTNSKPRLLRFGFTWKRCCVARSRKPSDGSFTGLCSRTATGCSPP